MLGRLILLAMIVTHALAREPRQVCVAICAPAGAPVACGSSADSPALNESVGSSDAASGEASCCAAPATGAATTDESCCTASPASCAGVESAACCGEPASNGVQPQSAAPPKSPCRVCRCEVDCYPAGPPPPVVPLPVAPERDSLVSAFALANDALAEIPLGDERIRPTHPAATPRFSSHQQRQSLLATWLK